MIEWGGRAAQALNAAVLRRDNYRCGWCGGIATTADHIVPRAAGGSDTLDNLQACCAWCNKSKGTADRPRRTLIAPPSRNWTGAR